MANSVDPDQTAPIGAVCSGSTLFASILNSSVMLGIFCRRRLQQTTFSDAFFLGAFRVKDEQVSTMDNAFEIKQTYIISTMVNASKITYISIDKNIKAAYSVTMNIFREKIFSF